MTHCSGIYFTATTSHLSLLLVANLPPSQQGFWVRLVPAEQLGVSVTYLFILKTLLRLPKILEVLCNSSRGCGWLEESWDLLSVLLFCISHGRLASESAPIFSRKAPCILTHRSAVRSVSL